MNMQEFMYLDDKIDNLSIYSGDEYIGKYSIKKREISDSNIRSKKQYKVIKDTKPTISTLMGDTGYWYPTRVFVINGEIYYLRNNTDKTTICFYKLGSDDSLIQLATPQYFYYSGWYTTHAAILSDGNLYIKNKNIIYKYDIDEDTWVQTCTTSEPYSTNNYYNSILINHDNLDIILSEGYYSQRRSYIYTYNTNDDTCTQVAYTTSSSQYMGLGTDIIVKDVQTGYYGDIGVDRGIYIRMFHCDECKYVTSNTPLTLIGLYIKSINSAEIGFKGKMSTTNTSEYDAIPIKIKNYERSYFLIPRRVGYGFRSNTYQTSITDRYSTTKYIRVYTDSWSPFGIEPEGDGISFYILADRESDITELMEYGMFNNLSYGFRNLYQFVENYTHDDYNIYITIYDKCYIIGIDEFINYICKKNKLLETVILNYDITPYSFKDKWYDNSTMSFLNMSGVNFYSQSQPLMINDTRSILIINDTYYYLKKVNSSYNTYGIDVYELNLNGESNTPSRVFFTENYTQTVRSVRNTSNNDNIGRYTIYNINGTSSVLPACVYKNVILYLEDDGSILSIDPINKTVKKVFDDEYLYDFITLNRTSSYISTLKIISDGDDVILYNQVKIYNKWIIIKLKSDNSGNLYIYKIYNYEDTKQNGKFGYINYIGNGYLYLTQTSITEGGPTGLINLNDESFDYLYMIAGGSGSSEIHNFYEQIIYSSNHKYHPLQTRRDSSMAPLRVSTSYNKRYIYKDYCFEFYNDTLYMFNFKCAYRWTLLTKSAIVNQGYRSVYLENSSIVIRDNYLYIAIDAEPSGGVRSLLIIKSKLPIFDEDHYDADYEVIENATIKHVLERRI